MTAIAHRLEQERIRLNISQMEMSRLGGVALSAYHSFEKGTRLPSGDFIEQAQGAGVDGLYIVTGQRDTATLSADETRLLELFHRAEERMQQTVLQLLQSYSA
ncbi:helix-turn-helix transcriptional regulator [Crenobacter sp. SG2303]|uniref:Helix-turn-helix transcriptional regulator n=1 Tax=Crenobacter oryzisoli TaxID=3056844 RepID=A0ABT7XP86_9NEIS|nr:helix-turn-helix transcriptional regulator [Crenobacter sp. SG2303]MDN0075614.1 helix-turn-helix transcriptional regulator [Crenobacter sp. SG2303]